MSLKRKVLTGALWASQVFLSFAADASPIFVGNGAGPGEFYLVHALSDFPRLIRHCLAQPECSNGVVRELMELEQAALPERFRFLSESQIGAVDWRNGPDRGVVEINRDRLWSWRDGRRQEWRMADAVAFLARVVSKDEPERPNSVVADRLAALVETEIVRALHPEFESGLLTLVRFKEPHAAILIEAESSGQSVVIPVRWENLLDCRASTGADAPVSAARVGSARWGVTRFDRARGVAHVLVRGVLDYTCPESGGRARRTFQSGYRLDFELSGTRSAFTVEHERFRAELTSIEETVTGQTPLPRVSRHRSP